MEATNLADTTEAKGSLLTALQSNLHLITYLNGRARSSEAENVAFSPDGKTLASGSDDGTIRLWDVATHQPLGRPLTGHRSGVTTVAFSSDGKTLASCNCGGTVNLWDVATHRRIAAPLNGHQRA